MDTLPAEVRLFKRNALGIGTWRIWADPDTLHYCHATVMGGAEVPFEEPVTINQSGRNISQQLELQMKSRISRMLDKGYKTTLEEAQRGATNQLGLANPMLAYPIDKVGHIDWRHAYVQRKYDGHRCLITKQDGEVIAYTRKGKHILTIPHILSQLAQRLPEGYTLDGELYVPGKSLQGIASLIKREQPGSRTLGFHAYDLVDVMAYDERLSELTSILEPISGPQLGVVETISVYSLESAWEYFRRFRAEGYEGAMVRQVNNGYEDNKRTSQLVKLKSRFEAEYKVVDVKPGKNEVGVMVLEMPDGKRFDCLAPGPVPFKQKMLLEKERFIGIMMPVEYAMLTEGGIPFHCVSILKEEL